MGRRFSCAVLAARARFATIDLHSTAATPLAHGQVWTLEDSVTVMLWPPPARGTPVTLTCGCDANVRVTVPVVFLYWIRIDVPEGRCRRAHRDRAHRLVGLESMQATQYAGGW